MSIRIRNSKWRMYDLGTVQLAFRLVVVLITSGGFVPFLPAAEGGSSDQSDEMQQEKSAEVVVRSKLNYLLSLPADYDQQPSHALLLFLHGAGERGDDQLDRLKVHGPPKLIARGRRFPCVVVSPQCPLNSWWDAGALSGLLDHIEQNYKIDPKRIYVTGLSMGGYGTWALAMREPDRFAAIAPICGGGNTRAAKYLGKISAPIWAFHGAKDTVIPLSELRDMEK
ncbi:MAG: dienelactone hydrolase family protein, partial [Planctomycetota bacterium]